MSGEAMAFDVAGVRIAFPVPQRHRRCVDVLEWHGEVTLVGAPAGRLWMFEIDVPRLNARGVPLGQVLDACLDGAYKELFPASARELWKAESRLLVVESIYLFPNSRGQGRGPAIVQASVDRLKGRGIGAAVLKAMPLQIVNGASPRWAAEMGAQIGSSPWFVDYAVPDEGYAKVADCWRRLGWREIRASRTPTCLLELAK
jgi:GNAT superfamily N-acetyltransferase